MDLKIFGNKTAEKRQNFAGYPISVGAEQSKIGAEIGRISPFLAEFLTKIGRIRQNFSGNPGFFIVTIAGNSNGRVRPKSQHDAHTVQ